MPVFGKVVLDNFGKAPTGTGKTIAFLVPALQRLLLLEAGAKPMGLLKHVSSSSVPRMPGTRKETPYLRCAARCAASFLVELHGLSLVVFAVTEGGARIGAGTHTRAGSAVGGCPGSHRAETKNVKQKLRRKWRVDCCSTLGALCAAPLLRAASLWRRLALATDAVRQKLHVYSARMM